MIITEIIIKRPDGSVIAKDVCAMTPGAKLRRIFHEGGIVELEFCVVVHGYKFEVYANIADRGKEAA